MTVITFHFNLWRLLLSRKANAKQINIIVVWKIIYLYLVYGKMNSNFTMYATNEDWIKLLEIMNYCWTTN